jgi:UDP-N-acetylglucosamine--N-acetylmuramyl-(pentapeptide) pyrophosphoryl-undecaprenol N-acetylglucosamine transferase
MKILVTGGSSGGHIFPALSFLDTLKAKYPEIDTLLILPQKCIVNQAESFSHKVKYVSLSSRQSVVSLKNFLFVFNLLKGSLQSLFVLLEFRPDIVVGFGSLASVPVVFLAWMFRIDTLIHEQNVMPGRANLFLAMFVDRIAVSFSQTRDYFKRHHRKIVFTGNPIRRQLTRIDKSRAFDYFGFAHDKFTILVMGGSQGSHRINLEFLKVISPEPGFQIVHLAGSSDYDFLKQRYQDLNVKARLFKFLEDMQYAYSVCDLVISRAGATTISEIIFFNLPAVLIPYPYAYAHQLANAKILQDKGCAILIKDEELGAGLLKNSIGYLLGHPDKIKNMRLAYRDFITPDAADALVRQALALNA